LPFTLPRVNQISGSYDSDWTPSGELILWHFGTKTEKIEKLKKKALASGLILDNKSIYKLLSVF